MRITGELRKWGYGFCGDTHDVVTAIADRIDAEHQKALDEWKAEHGQMWLKGYSECHAELLEGNETLASDLERCSWIRLPKDADGVPIHVGDMMAYADNTKPMEVVALVPPAVFLTEDGPRYADMCRHYHAPTVEDVLREFAGTLASADNNWGSDVNDAIAKYAAKLSLAEEDA